jgi:hypothetical protein
MTYCQKTLTVSKSLLLLGSIKSSVDNLTTFYELILPNRIVTSNPAKVC